TTGVPDRPGPAAGGGRVPADGPLAHPAAGGYQGERRAHQGGEEPGVDRASLRRGGRGRGRPGGAPAGVPSAGGRVGAGGGGGTRATPRGFVPRLSTAAGGPPAPAEPWVGRAGRPVGPREPRPQGSLNRKAAGGVPCLQPPAGRLKRSTGQFTPEGV